MTRRGPDKFTFLGRAVMATAFVAFVAGVGVGFGANALFYDGANSMFANSGDENGARIKPVTVSHTSMQQGSYFFARSNISLKSEDDRVAGLEPKQSGKAVESDPAGQEPELVAAFDRQPTPTSTEVTAQAPAINTIVGQNEEPAGALDEVETSDVEIVVRRGDTLFDILNKTGLDGAAARDVVDAIKAVYDPRKLRVGQKLAVSTAIDDGSVSLLSLDLSIDKEQDLELVHKGEGEFDVSAVSKTFVSERRRAEGGIDASLYLAADKAGVPRDTLMEFIRLYSWDVDFQRDIHPGDRFELLYERLKSDDGTVTKGGDILFAELTSGGEPLRAYRFETSDGSVGFYDEAGHSLRKWLMRTPVDGARLSSRFGKRKHPILGYTRMHKGVDFAAPRGTPIYAAGDGKITSLGRNGGYGKYIKIRHNGTYSTAYAHMHNYGKGLKKGSRVKQGQVIGYVGSTGRSTGPHLHYEIHKNGNQINPLSVKQDVAVRLKGKDLERFHKVRDGIDRELDDWSDNTLVADRR